MEHHPNGHPAPALPDNDNPPGMAPAGGSPDNAPRPAGPPPGIGAGPPAGFVIPVPDPTDLVPVVIPPASTAPASAPVVAFLLLPGALLYPKDYAALVEALKFELEKNPCTVWLAVAAVDWSKFNPVAQDASAALVDAAAEAGLQALLDAGFPAQSPPIPSGRVENLCLGAHSMATLAAGGWALRRAGSIALLGAGLIARSGFFPSVHAYPRPLLHVFAELDGQFHAAKAAPVAADAATSAPALGARAASRFRPVALIPGMNHAQFSNGHVNAARGDLQPGAPQEDALADVAVVLSAFLTSHAPDAAGDDVKAAVDVLQEATMRAARALAPLTRALGRTTAEDLLSCSEGACCQEEGDPDLARPLAHARGAEALPMGAPGAPFWAHPGEVHAAERCAVRAQKRALEAALPADIVAGCPVVAIAHTCLASFTCSQPAVLPCAEAPAGVAVEVHILLQREAWPEPPPGHTGPSFAYSPTAATCPFYLMKLKDGAQVAAAMGRSGDNREGEGPAVTAAALGGEVFEEALVEVGARARDTFQRRGREVRFREATKTPLTRGQEWVAAPVEVVCPFAPGERPSCTVYLPALSTPIDAAAPWSRFAGSLYVKVPSLAWAMEWVMVRGLREGAGTPPAGGPPPGVAAGTAGGMPPAVAAMLAAKQH